MRKIKFALGEYYHLVGRGVAKQGIFLDDTDYARFLFLLLHCQSELSFQNVGRSVKKFFKAGSFDLPSQVIEKIIVERNVEVISFTLMPNHFHLMVGEVTEKGISTYMHRILMAYAKYFNEKYKKSGHVFQGPFRAVYISSNAQLLHTSAYVHLNQNEISHISNSYTYTWSSSRDYIGNNRWGELLNQCIILDQFKDNKAGYKKFLEDSGVKEF